MVALVFYSEENIHGCQNVRIPKILKNSVKLIFFLDEFQLTLKSVGLPETIEKILGEFLEAVETEDEAVVEAQVQKVAQILYFLPGGIFPPLLLSSPAPLSLLSPLLLTARLLSPSSLSISSPVSLSCMLIVSPANSGIGMPESTFKLLFQFPPKFLTSSRMFSAVGRVLSHPWAQRILHKKIKKTPCKEYLGLSRCSSDFFIRVIIRNHPDLAYKFLCTPEEASETATFLRPYYSLSQPLPVFLRLFGKSESADEIVAPVLEDHVRRRRGTFLYEACNYLLSLESPKTFYRFFSEIIERLLPLDNNEEASVQFCKAIVSNDNIFDRKFVKSVILRKWKFVRPEFLCEFFPKAGGRHPFDPEIIELFFSVWAEKTPPEWQTNNLDPPLWAIKHAYENTLAYRSWPRVKFTQPLHGDLIADVISKFLLLLDDRSLRKAGRVCTEWFGISSKILAGRWEVAESTGNLALTSIIIRNPNDFRGSEHFIHPLFATEQIFRLTLDSAKPCGKLLEYLFNSGFSATSEECAAVVKKMIHRTHVDCVPFLANTILDNKLHVQQPELLVNLSQFGQKLFSDLETAKKILSLGHTQFFAAGIQELSLTHAEYREEKRTSLIECMVESYPSDISAIAEAVTKSLPMASEISENLLEVRFKFFQECRVPMTECSNYFAGIIERAPARALRKCLDILQSTTLPVCARKKILGALQARVRIPAVGDCPDPSEVVHVALSGIYEFPDLSESERFSFGIYFLLNEDFCLKDFTREFFICEASQHVGVAENLIPILQVTSGELSETEFQIFEESPQFRRFRDDFLTLMDFNRKMFQTYVVPYHFYFRFAKKYLSPDALWEFLQKAALEPRWCNKNLLHTLEFLDTVYEKYFRVIPEPTWPPFSLFLHHVLDPGTEASSEVREAVLQWVKDKQESLPFSVKFLMKLGEDPAQTNEGLGQV
jgi:hypothetical protein